MRGKERQPREREKSGVVKAIEDLKTKAEAVLASAGDVLAKENFDGVNEAHDDLSSALDFLILQNENIGEGDVENINTLVADFRKTLPENLRKQITDLEFLPSRVDKKLIESKEEAQAFADEAFENVEAIMKRINNLPALLDENKELLEEMTGEIFDAGDVYLKGVDKNSDNNFKNKEDLRRKFQDFAAKSQEFLERHSSAPPLSADDDSWKSLDEKGILSVEKQSIADLKKEVEGIKEGILKKLREIRKTKIVEVDREKKINEAYDSLLSSLDIYLDRAQLGQTDSKDKEAIDQMISRFYDNLKKEEGEMTDIDGVNGGERIVREKKMVDGMRKLAEKKVKKIKDDRKLSGEDLFVLETRTKRFYNELDEYLKLVDSGRVTKKDADEIIGKRNKFYDSNLFKVHTVDKKSIGDTAGALDDTLLSNPDVGGNRKTLGYDTALNPDRKTPLSGLGNGNGKKVEVDNGAPVKRRRRVVVLPDTDLDGELISDDDRFKTQKLTPVIKKPSGVLSKKDDDVENIKKYDPSLDAHKGEVIDISGGEVVDHEDLPLKTDSKELGEVKEAKEEAVLQEKIDLARGQVLGMKKMLDQLQNAYDGDIRHADLVPEMIESLDKKRDVLVILVGTLARFEEFFAPGKSHTPDEVYGFVVEVSGKFDESVILEKEVKKVKETARKRFEDNQKSEEERKEKERIKKEEDLAREKRKKQEELEKSRKKTEEEKTLKEEERKELENIKRELPGYLKESQDKIDQIDDLDLKIIGVQDHPLTIRFPNKVRSDLDAFDANLSGVRKSAVETEDMVNNLIRALKEAEKYKTDDSITTSETVAVIKNIKEKLSKVRKDFLEIEKTWEYWLTSVYEKEKDNAESRYWKENRKLADVLGILEDKQFILDNISEKVFPFDAKFAWPSEKEREEKLADCKTSAERIALIKKMKAEEAEFLKEAKDKINNLSIRENWSSEEAEELARKFGELTSRQDARIEMVPELYEKAADNLLASFRARKEKLKREFAKFYASPEGEKMFNDKLISLDVIISLLEKSKSEVKVIFEDRLEKRYYTAQLNKFLANYSVSMDMFNKAYNEFVEALGGEEKRLKEEDKVKKLAKIKKTKEEKEAEKNKKSKTDELPEEIAPLEPELKGHLVLRKPDRIKKQAEIILEKENILDIYPADIIKALSERDFSELKKLLDTKNQEDFVNYLVKKIRELAPTLQELKTNPDDEKKKIATEVYELMRRVVDKQVQTEVIKKTSRKLSKLKLAGKAIAGIGASLGIGYLAGSADTTLATGGLAVGVAAGANVLFREFYGVVMSTNVGKAVGEKIAGYFKDKKVVSLEKTKHIEEDVVDELFTKEKLAVLISNAVREHTTAEWIENREALTEMLSGKDTREISPEAYKDCLHTLGTTALEEFFKNSLNYVNVAPEYRDLEDEEKIAVAQTLALTIGQSYRSDVLSAQAFDDIKSEADIKGKSSWMAEKYFKMISGIKSGEFLKKHNKDDDKKWGRIAGSAWSVLVGGALAGTLRASSLTARVAGGAMTGAGIGLSYEQSRRRSAEDKLLFEAENILGEAEKELVIFESKPIDLMPLSKLKKFVEISAELQAKIDTGIVKDKGTKSRIDGLVYRIRKIEADKAMEMERSIDIMDSLANLSFDNNRAISKGIKKNLDRLRLSTRNKQPAYMIGGAIVGAGLSLALSSDFRHWVGDKVEEVREWVDNKKQEILTPPGSVKNILPAEAPDNTGPADFKSADSYAPAGEGAPYDMDNLDRPTPPVIPKITPESLPLIDPDRDDVVSSEEDLPKDNPDEGLIPETVGLENILSSKENADIWENITKDYPKLKDDLDWLKTALGNGDLDKDMRNNLSESATQLLAEYKNNGNLDNPEVYLKALREIVK